MVSCTSFRNSGCAIRINLVRSGETWDSVMTRINAADGVKPPRVSGPGEEIKPLDSEECAAFLAASHGERLEALYVLAVHCGLREGELLALHWEDVDLKAVKPALLVRRTLTRGE